jgi:hypothetical protein
MRPSDSVEPFGRTEMRLGRDRDFCARVEDIDLQPKRMGGLICVSRIGLDDSRTIDRVDEHAHPG